MDLVSHPNQRSNVWTSLCVKVGMWNAEYLSVMEPFLEFSTSMQSEVYTHSIFD